MTKCVIEHIIKLGNLRKSKEGLIGANELICVLRLSSVITSMFVMSTQLYLCPHSILTAKQMTDPAVESRQMLPSFF